MDRAGPSRQKVRGVDERDMGKSLGEIAKVAFGAGIVFLRKQADIVTQLEQTLE